MSKFNVNDKINIISGIYKGIKGRVVGIAEVSTYDFTNEPYYELFPVNSNNYEIINVLESEAEFIGQYKECSLFEESIYSEHELECPGYILLYEMAGRIPGTIQVLKKGHQGLLIGIGDNEGSIPHFHIYNNKHTKEKRGEVICLMFKYNAYFDHNDKSSLKLKREEIEAIVRKLKDWYDKENCTYWQFLVDLWNKNGNGNGKILDPNIEMPDYDFDTIISYNQYKKKFPHGIDNDEDEEITDSNSTNKKSKKKYNK